MRWRRRRKRTVTLQVVLYDSMMGKSKIQPGLCFRHPEHRLDEENEEVKEARDREMRRGK